MPALARGAEVPLERVTGLASAVERTASFAGAAMAGALVAFAGAANALIVDAVSFGVCAAVFAWSTASMRAERVVERPAGTTYVRELREGWTFLRKDQVLVAMSGMVAVTNLLDLAFSAVLLPVWIKESGYSVGVMGAYFATWAAASAVGSFVAAWAAERLPRFQVYVWAFLITGLPRFVLLALGVPWWMVLASCLVGGFASGFLNPILGAVIYERVPDADDGSRHHDQQRAVLVADAVRRPARGRALRDDRGHRRAARRRVRLPRRDHGAARDPGLPAVRQRPTGRRDPTRQVSAAGLVTVADQRPRPTGYQPARA